MAWPERSDDATGLVLDPAERARQKEATRQHLNTVTVPLLRVIGFGVLCLLAWLHDVDDAGITHRPTLPALVVLNLGYALASWGALFALRRRTPRIDLPLLLLHVDIVFWYATLHHLEATAPFYGYLLLVRVADQTGYGFRRAIWFSHVVVATYLGYAALMMAFDATPLGWPTRLTIAGTMYLIGGYLASTGIVIERLRARLRLAVRTARDLVDQLAQKTREAEARTRELERARAEAERANRAKTALLANVSHEFRTPMTGILGAIDVLAATPLTVAAQHEYLDAARRSGAQLLSLIDDMLDLSRLEGGEMPIRPRPFALRPVFDGALQAVEPAARAKKGPLALRHVAAEDLPLRVVGDDQRLRQVLVNLLANAVAYTDAGHVELLVKLLQREPRSVRLHIAVRDTGQGISPEDLPMLFEVFQRGDSSLSRHHGGLGVGLPLARQVVRGMGGELAVESQPGQGSVFWFELTLAVPDDAEVLEAQAPAGPRRILLVDDDAINRLVLQAMLANAGFDVRVVDNGEDACAAVAAGDVDLVFMDCHMPGMDGIEATRRIRAGGGAGAGTPIVALTADTLPETAAACVAAGMQAVLAKPIDAAALAEAARKYGSGGARTAA